MRKVTFYYLLFSVFLSFSLIQTQAQKTTTFNNGGGFGDGLWSTGANWDNGLPAAGDAVIIEAGQVCILDDGYVNNTFNTLTVQTAAQLLRNNSASLKLISLTGNIQCDGQIGNGSTPDAIVFLFEGTNQQINGAGIFDGFIFSKNATANTTTNLTINMDVTMRRVNLAAIYNNRSGTAFNVTIPVGVTVDVPSGSVSIDGTAGVGTLGGGGTFTVNGTLNVGRTLYLTTDNSAGFPCAFVVSGAVSCSTAVTNNSGTDGFATTLNSGASMNFTGLNGGWGALGATNNTYTINSAATVEFSASGNQSVGNPGASNLTLNGSGTKTLAANYTLPSGATLKFDGTAQLASGGFTFAYADNTGILEYDGSVDRTTGSVAWPTTGMNNPVLISSTATVTLNESKDLSGALTVNSGAVLNTSTFTLNAKSGFTNNGVISGGTTMKLNGTSPQTIAGTGEIAALNIDNANGVTIQGGADQKINTRLTLTSGVLTNNGSLSFANAAKITSAGGTLSNAGTLAYDGTVDVDYTAAVATAGDEIPSDAAALNNLTIGAAVGLSASKAVTVNGVLTLTAQFSVNNSNSLTVKNPIVTPANLNPDATTTLGIEGTASGMVIPNKTYGTININNANGASLNGNATTVGTVNFTSGKLNTGVFTLTATTLTGETAGTYLVGNVKTPAGNKNGGTDYLGLTPSANITGTNVVVRREAGPGKAVNVGVNTGINRKFTVSSSANDLTFTGTVNLKWVDDDLNGKNMNSVKVFEYDNLTAVWYDQTGGTGSPANQPNPGEYDFSSSTATNLTGATNLVEYTVTDNANPLPVELVSFTANLEANKVHLDWETATEVDNFGFEIERAKVVEGEIGTWEKIGFVEGSGNSNSARSYSFVDDKSFAGSFAYRLKQIDTDGSFEYTESIEVEVGNLPTEFSLEQNYPNPFNPTTTIRFSVPFAAQVKLLVYNMLGEQVAELQNGVMEQGVYEILFDGRNLASGSYIYVLNTGELQMVKKMLLVK